ncbi:BglG family transcription antiterminator [Listeria fleischmannii]|uniref:Transcription antiterminator n=1 Tax=Listeria fleischmannii TaxID=1069827 RepID=A0A841YCB8_9LIST|nr:BglG family transcription antiterminator [Listeria fleischmannii]EIA19917.1 PTS system IIA 2 / PRD domain protein [Listeria fleischmannii subsp. coloradonensis]MBC1397962.1 transcription antiterminator [Listeria fleischmannii]MBC1417798.1 transcription antiterminator [Listeria fleischmannii]MBC1426023.1 transcription antiterminator [Listeria fleischmannii]STY34295.1 Ascorbate-specific phosphotransferase enzyme IIA component [Listeria fleischmannii subsp. coloradonensis]
MKLDRRCIDVLDLLLTRDDYLKVKELALIFKTSERTIRYSLEKIDAFLIELGSEKLTRHPKKGVLIGNRNKISESFKKFKQQMTPEKYKYDAEEMEQFLLLKLLLEEEPVSVQYFQDILFISRSTVLNHLRAIDGDVFLNDMTIVHKTRIGYQIEGDLVSKCTLFARKLLKFMNMREFYQFLESEQSLSKKGELFFYNLFDLSVLKEAVSEVDAMTQNLRRNVDDQLYLTILVMLLKMRSANPEFRYETWQNAGSKYDLGLEMIINTVKQFKDASQIEHVIGFSKRLCIKMGELYHTDFLTNNQVFFNQITSHISLMIKRIRSGISVENPIFFDFMRDNKELFLTTKRICEELEEEFEFSASAQEVSFLAIYFASELERNVAVERNRPTLLIVCAEGMAVSNMLQVQLNQLFEFSSISTTSLRKFDQKMLDQFDYVLTTIKIPDMTSKKIIRIHSYLQKEDMQVLQEHFQMKLVTNRKQAIDKFSEIMNIISENTQITNLSKLELDLLDVLTKQPKKEHIELPEIEFKEQLIVTKKHVNTWQQAIRLGTEVLFQTGCIEKRYTEKIIQNLKSFGPYMVIAPGIVLAHASPKDGVLKDSMAVTVLEEGISFFDRYGEPVRLIFTLAFESKEARRLVEQLMKVVLNEEQVSRILSAKSHKDIYNYTKSAIYE